MNRLATKITTRHHAYMNDRSRNTTDQYINITYEVGKHHIVPNGNETDEVVEIRVSDEWRPHVEVEYKDWGIEWILDHIVNVEFYNHERFKEVLREKREARESQDPKRKPPSLSENIR